MMVDRTAGAAAEIATLRQKLAPAEARIQEMDHLLTVPMVAKGFTRVARKIQNHLAWHLHRPYELN